MILGGAGGQIWEKPGVWSQKKNMPEKKNTLGKKKYRCSPKGVSECGKKKYSRKKKITAVQQKE